jgi:hypothetical protein
MIEDGITAMGPPNSNKQLADFHAQFDRFPYQKDIEMTEIRSNNPNRFVFATRI